MAEIEIVGPEDERLSLGGYDDYRAMIPDYSGLEPRYDMDEKCLEIYRSNGIDAPEHIIAHEYFLWLCSQVGLNGRHGQNYRYIVPDDSADTYFTVATKLMQAPYKVIVPRDENRVADAKMLRYYWANLHSTYREYTGIARTGATLLEVLVALVQRFDSTVMMNSKGIDRSKDWFWQIMENTALINFDDSHFEPTINDDGRSDLDTSAWQISSGIIENICNRTYEFSGTGGCFPLKNPQNDQRKVELWYQMHAFFNENDIN